ncbi:stage II sporulation protein M [Coriobacteriia bacterium Es71-Z0120]|uniref:stage II sporulation protein M n=1 Tax=Parvivirga hydrogeniphila TaxID=2939460 RepID=UPI002260A493|nr:stage II sporulation protein M [Parvivirga hydrogeniphila]MCL4079393.1 stage II sporulation protein M [Parvivirga hydrogeniphila]
MEEREFVEGSRAAWQRLAELTERAHVRGVDALDAATLKRMHEDYRRAAADLAYAQTHFAGSQSERALNALVSQAHGVLYGRSQGRLSQAVRFMAVGYPRLVREHWRTVALSALLLFGSGVLGAIIAAVDPALARTLLPQMLRDVLGEKEWSAPSDGFATMAPLVSAAITTNNIQVSLYAFAGGITFGALTAYALVQNGLMLGILTGAIGTGRHALEFWSLIVPHGALELPAIVLAGASGLTLARALVAPGDLPRADALRAASQPAVLLVLGAVPLLLVAGAIEGFLTPARLDPAAKVAFGGAMAFLLGVYVLLPGRERRAR